LISYRIPVTIAPLFSVDVIFNQIQNTRIEVMAKIKSNYKEKSTAHYVIVYIPVPEDAQKSEFSY
jgi:hypothetical protein